MILFESILTNSEPSVIFFVTAEALMQIILSLKPNHHFKFFPIFVSVTSLIFVFQVNLPANKISVYVKIEEPDIFLVENLDDKNSDALMMNTELQ